MRPLRLGTRGSALARWQATWVARSLTAVPGAPDIEVVIIRTRGDADHSRPLAALGGTGVFVKELEERLIGGEIDLAVHSLKDLETRMPDGLVLGAVPERAPVEDALVARDGLGLDELPAGARVATGSPRRAALLRVRRPDLELAPLRGNVPTRLERIAEGAADATVLARAGLVRLGLADRITEVLDPAVFTPAAGQGALGVQCRADDGELVEFLGTLDHAPTHRAVDAERAFLHRLGAGCHLPAGAWARTDGDRLVIDAFGARLDGSEVRRFSGAASPTEAAALGERAADGVLAEASDALREELRTGHHPPDEARP